MGVGSKAVCGCEGQAPRCRRSLVISVPPQSESCTTLVYLCISVVASEFITLNPKLLLSPALHDLPPPLLHSPHRSISRSPARQAAQLVQFAASLDYGRLPPP